VAVGAQSGSVEITDELNGRIDAEGPTITVSAVTVDELSGGRFDVVKLDIEGYEGHALAGAERTLAQPRHPSVLFVELHPAWIVGYTIDEVITMVQPHFRSAQFYEIPPLSVAEKVRERYANRTPVREIMGAALERLLADCRSHERMAPFWMVCKR
jgi:hypothetical protein